MMCRKSTYFCLNYVYVCIAELLFNVQFKIFKVDLNARRPLHTEKSEFDSEIGRLIIVCFLGKFNVIFEMRKP